MLSARQPRPAWIFGPSALLLGLLASLIPLRLLAAPAVAAPQLPPLATSAGSTAPAAGMTLLRSGSADAGRPVAGPADQEPVIHRPRLLIVLLTDWLPPAALAQVAEPSRQEGLGWMRHSGWEHPGLRFSSWSLSQRVATLATGTRAARHGIVGDRWLDRLHGRIIRSSRDLDATPTIRYLRAPTLGDWLRRRWPDARVVALAPVEPVAILLAGRRGLPLLIDTFSGVISSPGRSAAWLAQAQPPAAARQVDRWLAATERILTEEQLGQDEIPDLLWLQLPELLLPESSAQRDPERSRALELHRFVDGLLRLLDQRVGREQVGLLFVNGWTGPPSPRRAEGVGLAELSARLEQQLTRLHGAGPWVAESWGDGIALHPPSGPTAPDAQTLRRAACDFLRSQPGIADCRPRPTETESAQLPPEVAAEFDPTRTWDLQLIPESTISIVGPAGDDGVPVRVTTAAQGTGPLWLVGPGAPRPFTTTLAAHEVVPLLATWLTLDPLPELIPRQAPRTTEPAAPRPAPQGTLRLTLLHTNDHHGQDLDHPGPRGKGEVGGLAMRSAMIEAIRREAAGPDRRVLVLDAGDVSTGACPATRLRSRSSLQAMDDMGYEAMVVGNHEFDQPLSGLLQQLDRLSLPVISSNIFLKETNGLLRPPVLRLELAGFRVAVLGLTTDETPLTSTLGDDPRLRFADVRATAQEWVSRLRPTTDLLIALTHQGLNEDLELARTVPGIDLIVGGHTHDPLPEPVTERGTLVLQAGSYGQFLGRAELELAPGQRVKLLSYQLLPVVAASTTGEQGNPEITMPLRELWETVAAACQAPVGVAAARFERAPLAGPGTGSTLAHLVADSLRWRAKTDIALQNEGGLREDLPAGEVTRGAIQAVLPFANTIIRLELKGVELLRLLEEVARRRPGEYGFLHASGMTWSILEQRPAEVKIGGEPLRPERVYTVAVNSFLARGGDGYQILTNLGRRWDSGFDATETLAEYIREFSPVQPDTTLRVVRSAQPVPDVLPTK